MRETGKRGPSVSLSLPGLENNRALWVLIDSGQSRDPWDNMLFHELAIALMRRGIPEKQIWAFFWYVVAEEAWNDVALLLKERLGVEVQSNALRQWPRRCFERILAELRALLEEGGGSAPPPRTPVRPRPASGKPAPTRAKSASAPSQNRVTRGR